MATSQARVSLERKTQSAMQRALSVILSGDLDFHSEASNYASHALHAFAAKFPPQLPRVFIEGLTDKGETVLDPMMGSGTAIVEDEMTKEREYWIQTRDTTFLYYKVKARSKEGALIGFQSGRAKYVGCNDDCNEQVIGVLEDKPYTSWT